MFVPKRLVEVLFVNTAVDGVEAPIVVLLMVPPEMVRASFTFVSSRVPVYDNESKAMVPLLRVPTVERFGSEVMETTEVVAARFETKFEVARAVVKYRLVGPSSKPSVVVEYQDARVR